ncbi:DUF6932 family protein [Candidatus Vondammii sp. HM_W22]|uniref:DUF6932 family protein n=1 Tax=Candidatus Vondammii sp. HM_W22 TaxID=2687299 RepID=UPI002E7B3FDE|nr:hypothetical protein [Candidatus Vondammii sp. HM_W22]
MTIPSIDNRGLLPPGIYQAGWNDVYYRFGFTFDRFMLIRNAHDFSVQELAVFQDAQLFLAGSMISDNAHPEDIEMTIKINIHTLSPSLFSRYLIISSAHDRLLLVSSLDFYFSINLPGLNDFISFFQYAGKKNGIVRNINIKDKRGIIEVTQWMHE